MREFDLKSITWLNGLRGSMLTNEEGKCIPFQCIAVQGVFNFVS